MPILRDWRDSFRVNALDAFAERFFVRLLMACDDFGRYHADDRLLNSGLFPLHRDIRDTDVARWKAACLRAGLIRCYVDAAGRAVLEVDKFGQRKKFMRASFDPPDGQQHFFLPPPKTDEVEAEGKKKAASPQPVKSDGNGKPARELWQLLKDEKELLDRLKFERERAKPDPELIEAMRKNLQQTRTEMKQT